MYGSRDMTKWRCHNLCAKLYQKLCGNKWQKLCNIPECIALNGPIMHFLYCCFNGIKSLNKPIKQTNYGHNVTKLIECVSCDIFYALCGGALGVICYAMGAEFGNLNIWYVVKIKSTTRFPRETTSIMKRITVSSRKGIEIYEHWVLINELSPGMVQIWLKCWVKIANKCTKNDRTEHMRWSDQACSVGFQRSGDAI